MKIKNFYFTIPAWIIFYILLIAAARQIYYIDRFITIPRITFPAHQQQMLWAHRGFHVRHQENSLDSFLAAAEAGFYGIELDIRWRSGKKDFLIAHDAPGKAQKTLTKPLYLSEVFARLQDHDLYFWCDLKNWNVSKETAEEISRYFNTIIARYHLQKKLFLESTEGATLARIKNKVKGLTPVFWIKFDEKNLVSGYNYQILKEITVNRFPVVSMNKNILSKKVHFLFGHLRIFAWNYNSPAEVKSQQGKWATVMLTDEDLRKDFPEMFRNPEKN